MSEEYRMGGYVPFLSPNKKGTERSRHRGGADREAYRNCLNHPPLLPRLRAALPYVPLPAPVEAFIVVEGNLPYKFHAFAEAGEETETGYCRGVEGAAPYSATGGSE